jgi:hypothetical protein
MPGTEKRHSTEPAWAEFFDDVPESVVKVHTAVIGAPCRAG